jgi:hypothetical protein
MFGLENSPKWNWHGTVKSIILQTTHAISGARIMMQIQCFRNQPSSNLILGQHRTSEIVQKIAKQKNKLAAIYMRLRIHTFDHNFGFNFSVVKDGVICMTNVLVVIGQCALTCVM